MTSHELRSGLLAIALLLSAWPGSAWSGDVFAAGDDAECFAGLIPGTQLSDEELARYYGRGLHVASIERFWHVEAISFAESLRESIRERIEEFRAELSFSRNLAAEAGRISPEALRLLTQALAPR